MVAASQISVGMWRRNGSTADSQVRPYRGDIDNDKHCLQAFLYHSKKYCPGIREADLLLLQMVAALCDDVDTFLVSTLAK